MICEKCHNEPATVHLTHKAQSEGEVVERREHYCAGCYEQLRKVRPDLNLELAADKNLIDETEDAATADNYPALPGTRSEKLRVTRTHGDKVVMEVVGAGSEPPEEWRFLKSRLLPRLRLWPVGKIVRVRLTETALDWFQGKRDDRDQA